MSEINAVDRLTQAWLDALPADYLPAWDFGYVQEGGDGGGTALYASPASVRYKQTWPAGRYLESPEYEEPEYTSQDYYTGKVPGAVRLDENNLPEEYRKDYDMWQGLLNTRAGREDSWSPLGDQFFTALAALGLATGGAAAFGGFAAPEAAALTAAGGAADVGGVTAPVVLPGAATPASLAAGGSSLAADVGGSVAPVALGAASTPAFSTAGGFVPLAAGAAAGGGTLSTLGDIAGLLGPIISGGTSILGAINAGNAARDAAETQAGAANDANQLLWQMYNQNRADLEPYRQAGYASLGQLAGLVDQPFAMPAAYDPSAGYVDPTPYQFSPTAGRFDSYGFSPTVARFDDPSFAFNPSVPNFTDPSLAFNASVPRFNDPSLAFTPPSGQQVLTDDPGYQFRVEQGMKALEGSAAARGGLLSGGTAKAITNYGQGAASQEYQNAYNRALGRNILGYQRTADQYARERGENELRYGRTRDQYGRELGENELRFGRGQAQYNRELAENELGYGRVRDQYGREVSENERQWDRLLQANQLNYGRAYQQNVDQANRALANRNLRFRELGDIAGIGQSATGAGVQLGANLGQQVGGNILSGAASRAAGDVGAASAWNTAAGQIGSTANKYLELQYLNNLLRSR